MYHCCKLERKEFHPGDLVLFYYCRHQLFSEPLKSKLYGPFNMVKTFLDGAIELLLDGDVPFKVNGHCVMHYIGSTDEIKVCENESIDEV